MPGSSCESAQCRSYPCSWLLLVSLLLLRPEQSQTQFVNVRGERRLLFTAAGVRQAFTDPGVGSISLAQSVLLNQTTWPGVVPLSRQLSIDGLGTPGGVATIDFGGVTDAIFVNATGNLTFQSLILQGATSQNGFSTLLPKQQFLHIQGSGIWPTVIQDLGSTVTIVNSTIRYYVPQPISCVNYTAKLVFGLTGSLQGNSRYSVAPDGVTLYLIGDSTFEAPITDPNSNATLGTAILRSVNTTNICLESVPPPPPGIASSSGSKVSGGGIAGIVIGALVAVALIGLLAGFLLLKRRRRRKLAAQSLVEKDGALDSEHTTATSDRTRASPNGSTLLQHGYLPPNPSTGQIAAMLASDDTPIISKAGPIGSSHSQTSSQGDIRSLSSFGGLGGSGGPGQKSSLTGNSIDAVQLQQLLRHRNADGLSGVEVGPLLGRGSYGRVYKGRWKGVAVAIKVVDHMSAAGNAVDAARESVLSSSVQHPNVVTTYKICTIRLTDLPTALPQAPAASQSLTELTAGTAEATEGNVQRLNDSLASGAPPMLEKNDSAKVSQGKTPGTSPHATYDAEQQQQQQQRGNASPFAATPITSGDQQQQPALRTTASQKQQAGLEPATSGQSERTQAQEAQGVSVEALLATRPTPSGVTFKQSDPRDWDDDHDSDEDPELKQAAQPKPNIVETWMLLEYCDRGNLDSAMRNNRFRRKADSAPDLVSIYRCLIDIAAGMDYLHSVGMLHGDLKAANVLCKSTATDPRGFTCKLADFGLSRLLDPTMTHVSTKSYGTISYMPAEVLKDGRLTTAADVYSFAMMMWEIYNSKALFEGQTMAQVFYMVCYEQHRPAIPEDMPIEYRELMQECWAHDSEARPKFSEISPRLQNLYTLMRQNSRPSEGNLTGRGSRTPGQPPGQPPFSSPFAGLPPSASPHATPNASSNRGTPVHDIVSPPAPETVPQAPAPQNTHASQV